jgi:hypothetical protein
VYGTVSQANTKQESKHLHLGQAAGENIFTKNDGDLAMNRQSSKDLISVEAKLQDSKVH